VIPGRRLAALALALGLLTLPVAAAEPPLVRWHPARVPPG
jgi:hypothetical protein